MTLHYHAQPVSSQTVMGPGTVTLNAYPNPFREELTVQYAVLHDESIELGIFNVLGQQVYQLTKGFHSPDNYHFTWDGTDRAGKSLPSGMYYIIFVKGEEKQVLKIMKSR